jgi:hypothetical protein
MDNEQRLEQELEERFDCLGEIDTHYLCHIVQTIPLYIDSQPLRERVYNFIKKVVGEYSEIDGESIYDNRDRFVQGELVFVLKEDSLTVGVVITKTIEDQTCKLWVIGNNGECYIEQVLVSRILKYRDILEHIEVETAYKLKKKLYNLDVPSVHTDQPIWFFWRFFETSSRVEEFGMQVYTVPIPNNQANKILCKDVLLSDDGWHYSIVEDVNNTQRMLWGYIDLPITFDKPINSIERIVQDWQNVFGELKVIKSFRPYGMVDDIDGKCKLQ